MTAFGMNMRLWYGRERALADLQRIADGGLRRVRYAVLTDRPRDYPLLDAVVARATALQLQQTMTLIDSSPPRAPDRFVYLQAVTDIATRYHDTPHLTLEIWNEPNTLNFWKPQPAMRDYAALLRAAISAIDTVAPKLSITNGGLVGADAEFLDALRAEDAWRFDVLSMHPYTWGPSPDYPLFVGDILKMQAYLKGIQSAKRLDLNEFGWAVPDWVSEDVRCSYVRAAASICTSLGVDGADLYCLGDPPGGSCDLTGTRTWDAWCAASKQQLEQDESSPFGTGARYSQA